MPYFHESLISHSVDEVFAWHERPGALARLLPPWQPVTLVKEAGSLRDGEAILGLPGGLRWHARHDPSSYAEGRSFSDVLANPLLGRIPGWRHHHGFAEEGSSRTRITDRVETLVPGPFLAEMFAYRTRQLVGDLDAHKRFGSEKTPLRVAMTGSSGLIGSALAALLTTGGHVVIRLVRRDPVGSDRVWDPMRPARGLLQGVDAVVHLAGASITGRFTPSHKQLIWSSRVAPTRLLAEEAARSSVQTFVSASAIGYYGADRGDEELTEESSRGDGFLARLVEAWEEAASMAGSLGGRVVVVRTGIVLSPRGGVLRLLRPLFMAGFGGPIGGGRGWTSWIGVDDVADVYLRSLLDPGLQGPINATAPLPVRNAELTHTLARILRRPALVPVPKLGPRVLLGSEGATELALANQRVLPARLLGASHRFRHPTLEESLRHLLGRTGARAARVSPS